VALSVHLDFVYRRSSYRMAGQEFVIGRRHAGLDDAMRAMGVREGTLITAWNPRSGRKPAPWNARMMAALLKRLRGRRPIPAASGFGRWQEDMLFVPGDRRFAAHLARVFRQAALVDLRAGQKPRLLPLI
jgi:hypothetical protein